MITKELAVTLRVGQVLWHNTLTNADKSPLRARVNGQCKTWKTRPTMFQLPMKRGMKECFYLNEPGAVNGGEQWSLPDRWAVERHWKD